MAWLGSAKPRRTQGPPGSASAAASERAYSFSLFTTSRTASIASPGAAADLTLGLLKLALRFQVAVAYDLARLRFDRSGRHLQAAFDPLPVHFPLPTLDLCLSNKRWG
jgi:hypothetical protein